MKENYFDFFSVKLFSHKKTPLKKMGFTDIEAQKDGYEVYGRGNNAKHYPRYVYSVHAGFFDVGNDVETARKNAEERACHYQGAFDVAIEYHTRD